LQDTRHFVGGKTPKTTDNGSKPVSVHAFYIMHIYERSFMFGILI
jgi:hypothetical protein